jgi:hypothetical protein
MPVSAMRRRDFITLLGGAAATWPMVARAQQPARRVYKIGYQSVSSRQRTLRFVKAFEDGLWSLGYRVGENVTIEYRFANGDMERLPTLAADMIRLGVDVHDCRHEGDHDHPDCHDRQYRSGQYRACRQSGAPWRQCYWTRRGYRQRDFGQAV